MGLKQGNPMKQGKDTRTARAQSRPDTSPARDFLALGITIACIIMFVGLAGPELAKALAFFSGEGIGTDRVAVSALLLNIALLIFSWLRYRRLHAEVNERRKAENLAHQLAQTDPLTGCYNRRSIGGATDTLMKETDARGDIVAFFMVDLDNFKQVNDYHGHSTGDAILVEAAERITRLLPSGGLLARIGGDEFACVIPFPPSRPEAIDRLASTIIDALARPIITEQANVDVTVSLGIARSDMTRIEDVPADSQRLLHMADVAMYHAKKQGRNRYFWFEMAMENELRFRSELETGLRRGIPLGEFVPYYEQQIDLVTGRLTGFEMLARWNSPTLGTVNPEVFIPVAEEIGIIADLSESLIRQALRDAREWDPELTLSVNISPVQLRDPWFAQKMLKLLVEANFPPNRLEIEITETSLHENINVVRTLITSLKNQGVRVSLDDFGTGYSSLAQLRTLPFDRIKIDRSFVMTMHTSSDSATIVEAITSLGKGLGLPVTAEGIESDEVRDDLLRFGDLKGQGYLYGRPETAQQTRERLALLGFLPDATSVDAANSMVADVTERQKRKFASH